MQQQIHLGQQKRQRLGLTGINAVLLQTLALFYRVGLLFQVAVGFDQKAAGAAGRVQHGLAQARVGHSDHELHNRTRGIELTRITGSIAHFAQQGFVQPAQGVDFVRRIKMNGVNQVDDIAQQITALHAVGQALKHGGDDVAPLPSGGIATQSAQIGEQAGTLGAGG